MTLGQIEGHFFVRVDPATTPMAQQGRRDRPVATPQHRDPTRSYAPAPAPLRNSPALPRPRPSSLAMAERCAV